MLRATLRDVAERSGVSITTASHVLNDVPGKRVNPQTRARVLSVAEELLYRPNQLARGLRTQRTGMIGFLSDRVSTTPFAGRMILGAQDEAAEADSMLVLLNSGGDAELEEREVDVLIERQVDAIVYALYYHRVVIPPANLVHGRAVLLDGRSVDGRISSVVPDEVGGAYTAVTALLAAGHRQISFLTAADDTPAVHLRLKGFHQALEAYDIVPDPLQVVVHDSNADGGYVGAIELLTRPDRPTGIFCYNDRMAMGVYQAAAELGLSVPGDISVIGFDDQELISDSLRPGLTTVALPHYEMGRWAVRALLDQIGADGAATPTHARLPCPLVRRGSVASPPAVVRGPCRQPVDSPGGDGESE